MYGENKLELYTKAPGRIQLYISLSIAHNLEQRMLGFLLGNFDLISEPSAYVIAALNGMERLVRGFIARNVNSELSEVMLKRLQIRIRIINSLIVSFLIPLLIV